MSEQLTLTEESYSLSIVEDNDLQLTLSGERGPAGVDGAAGAAGPNEITTATTTNLTGFISGNGTNIAGATAAASAATANTLVLRDANGGASFAGVTLSGVNTNSGSYSQVGGANFNVATTTAANLTATGSGTVTVSGESGTTISGGTLTFSPSGFAYGTGAASAHRIALGAGTTGSELFGAADAAAARTTLGVRTFKTTSDVSNSTQTPSNGNVPELTFAVVSGQTYKVDFSFILNATGNFAHQIRATYPTQALPFTPQGDCFGLHRFNVKIPTPGATTLDFNTSSAGASTNGLHSGYWFYRPSASGNVTFQVFNFDASVVTTTLKAGSLITVTEL